MAALKNEFLSSPNEYFQVNYKTIEGYIPLLNRKTPGLQCDYVLASTLFSPPTFSSHTHQSIPLDSLLSSQPKGLVMAPIDQVCFFYTTHRHLPSLLLVLELVAVPIDSNSAPFVLGWGWCTVDVLSKNKAMAKVRVPLFEGTSRVLLTITDIREIYQAEGRSSVIDIPGCIVTLFLSSHPTLSKADRFIPVNTLVAFDDIIPGLIHTNVPEAFPKILKSHSLSVEKLALSLLPTVEIFESEFLKLVKEDMESECVVIDERRIKFLPYNGWSLLSPSAMAHVTPPPPLPVGSSPSLSRSSLVFHGSLVLPPIPPHHLTEIIVQLEYILKLDRQVKQGQPPSSDAVTVTLCWGVWRPFIEGEGVANGTMERYTIDLKRGPGYESPIIPNSAHKTCYEGNLTDIGRVSFLATPSTTLFKEDNGGCRVSTGNDGNVSEHGSRFNIYDTEDSNLFQSGIEPADSGVTLDRDNELGQPQNMSTPVVGVVTSTKRSPETPLTLPTRIHVTGQDITTLGTKLWVEPISRSLLAQFYSCGVPELTTPTNGKTLTYVDISKRSAIAPPTSIDNNDSVILKDLLSQNIVIQLMGMEFLATPPKSASYPSFSPSSVVINYQFLHDTPTSAHLHLVKLSSDASLPFLLSIEKGGGRPLSYKSSHVLPSNPSPSDEQSISRYFTSSSIVFSIYNGDSSIIIGAAILPLQILYPFLTKKLVHVPMRVPVVYCDTGDIYINAEALAEGGSYATVGSLYLSLGVSTLNQTPPILPHPLHSSSTPSRFVISYPLPVGTGNGTERINTRAIGAQCSVPISTATLNEACSIEEEKHASITSVLRSSLSSFVSLTTRIGETAYFQHKFTNRSSGSVSVGIKWSNIDLCVVTSAEEAVYFRKRFNFNEATDNPTILSSNAATDCQYSMYMSANETITIPFKYMKEDLSSGGGESIEVRFYNNSGSDVSSLLSVLVVKVMVMEQRTDRVFHFYPTEGTFMKKEISLPFADTPQQLMVKCSDPNTTCCIRQSQHQPLETQGNKHQSVVGIKVAVGKSPRYSEIMLIFYKDDYMAVPFEIWKLCLQSVQRLAHSVLIGQSSALPVSIKGDHLNRKISYLTHTSNGLKVVAPSSHFIGAYSLNEVSISLKTLVVGSNQVLLSAKDDMAGEVVKMWCVDVTAVRPTISRGFTVALAVGEDQVEKSISWTNPYSKKKSFYLSSTCPDLVSFTEESIKLRPSETIQLAILFRSTNEPIAREVILFVSNKNDLIEECFLIKVTYQ